MIGAHVYTGAGPGKRCDDCGDAVNNQRRGECNHLCANPDRVHGFGPGDQIVVDGDPRPFPVMRLEHGPTGLLEVFVKVGPRVERVPGRSVRPLAEVNTDDGHRCPEDCWSQCDAMLMAADAGDR